jgi:DNA polymerase III sliding clamp (beta) subunit (PCNA family)
MNVVFKETASVISEAVALVTTASKAAKEEDLFDHIVFYPDSERVRLLTANGSVFSSVSVTPDYLETPTPFTLHAKRFSMWLETLAEDDTLTFSVGGGSVLISSSRGEINLPSLDADTYPFWDNALSDSEVVTEMEAHSLKEILSFLSPYVSRDEQAPTLCLVQLRDRTFYATDRKKLTLICPSSEEGALQNISADASVKCFVGNLSNLTSFLSKLDEKETVTIREHQNGTFYVAKDAIFVENSYSFDLPALQVPTDTRPDLTLTFDVEELDAAIQFLMPTADWGKPTFDFTVEEERLIVQTSPENFFPLRKVVQEWDQDPRSEILKEFTLDYKTLQRMKSDYTDEGKLKFYIQLQAVRGRSYPSLRKEENGMLHFSAFNWARA